jgi:hypothetical protein
MPEDAPTIREPEEPEVFEVADEGFTVADTDDVEQDDDDAEPAEAEEPE